MKTSIRANAQPRARKSGTFAGPLACALFASTCLATPALAQTVTDFRQLDRNGVDLTHGDFVMAFEEGSIGSGKAELSLVRRDGYAVRSSQWDSITFRRTVSGSIATITIGMTDGTRERFTGGAFLTSFTSTKANGATLTRDNDVYSFTAPDGAVTTFYDPTYSWETGVSSEFCSPSELTASSCKLLPSMLTAPDGTRISFQWWARELSFGSYETILEGVANNLGYSIDFINSYYAAGNSYIRSGANFHNDAAGAAAQASVSYAYPSGVAAGITDVTDMAGNTWRISSTSIRRPGETSPGFTVTRNSGTGIVSSVLNDGITTNYSRTVSGNTATMTITNALNQQTVVTSNLSFGRPTSITDPLNRTTYYGYDSYGRLIKVTQPEGNYVQLTLDARGNVTETRTVAKAGSGLADIVTSASFPATCSNARTCNRPTSTTDARGNVTDYEYAANGGVSRITAPPAASGVRPQTRFEYQAVTAYDGFTTIDRLTAVSACQTQAGASGTSPAACAGTADEVRTVLAYDSRGNISSVSSGAGDGSLTATSTMSYDGMGDLKTVDGPLATAADTTRYRYDAARRPVGVVSPDPDGAGALKHRASRMTYRADGLPIKIETGTVASQSDADWAAFAPAEAMETEYADNRPVIQKLVADGAVHSLTQTSYDAVGRPECTAARMNLAAYASLPTSACALGTGGSFGPDRITKTVRDAAGQVTQVLAAYGTADQATEITALYSDNGKLRHLYDAENNRTDFAYDGHDRPGTIVYPSPVKSSGTVNGSDYENFTFDAAGNVVSYRPRSGPAIGYGYDALNRLVTKDRPGTEPDVSYGYDNLGRLTSASYTGHALSFTYDALGRQLTETGPLGTVRREYDLAGTRTSLTWPDAIWSSYQNLVTGDLEVIRQVQVSDVTELARFGHDDLGHRVSLTRGNGTVTTYAYGAAGRLDTLAQDVASGHDVTLGFDYNPAGQIAARSISNNAYLYPHVNESTASTVNGLNQLVTHGGVAIGYDLKGNLTSDGATTFVYDAENKLVSASGAKNATLSYDPLGRLFQVSGPSGATRFLYDGLDRIGEYDPNTGALIRRHVFGPSMDEPLVWYEGSGLTDRHFLHADERGSIVAVSDDSGTVTAINAYNEYGVPADPSFFRFGYTGQAWLPELGLQYSKARMYGSEIGRFYQIDPIGYEAGMNLYAYVGNDPVNFVDPLGLSWQRACVTGPAVNADTGRVEEGRTVETCSDVWVDDNLHLLDALSRSGGYTLGVTQPDRGVRQSSQQLQKPKPAYCSSMGYKIGDFIDNSMGGTAKDVGTGVVIAGGAVTLATWFTGVGAGAGGAIAGIGGAIYAGGAATSLIGSGVKWLSGQSAENSAAALLGWSLMRTGPVTRIVADKFIGELANYQIANKCD